MTAIPEHPLYPPYRQPMLEADGTVTRPWLLYFESLNTNVSNIVNPVTGVVTHTGALVNNELVIGNGASDVKPLGSTGTVHQVLHGNAAGAPAFSAVDLSADVTGLLPFANLVNATGASKLVGRGSAGGAGPFQELTTDATLAITGTVLGATSGIVLTTATLTNAQVLALPTTHVTLIAAPGAGLAIHPIGGVAFAKTSAGAYANLDPTATLNIQYGTTNLEPAWNWIVNDAAITNGSKTLLSDWLGTTTNTRAALVPYMSTEGLDDWGPLPILASTTNIANQPVAIDISNAAAGNLTGGNAANTVTFLLWWATVTVP